MNKFYLIFFLLITLVVISCNKSSSKSKILGIWHSEDKKTSLKITAKEFILDEGEEPIAESYFVKDDSIFTSYEGSQPYTKFVVKDLSDKSLTLIYPDSISVKFSR